MTATISTRPLGLGIVVSHPDSELHPTVPEADRNDLCDSDGHCIFVAIDEMCGEHLVELGIRIGLSATTAADILRKIALRLEQNGDGILLLRDGSQGVLSPNGAFEESGLGND